MSLTTKYSMLVSVYKKVNHKHFRQCLESIFSQTYPAEQVVVVCDGPLTKELDEVISDFEEKYPSILDVLRFSENKGTGAAANAGIDACRNNLILKTDSDDICRKNRAEIQVAVHEKNPAITMSGGFIREFLDGTDEEIAVKKVPLSHNEIVKYAKRRNPINNPTIAIKKDFSQKIGGFDTDARCEDYDFVCRMLHAGAKAENVDEILLDYRVSPDNLKRRKNWKNTKSFIQVRYRNFKRGFCSFFDFLIPSIAQLLMFILPTKMTGAFYKKILRK